MKTTLNLTDRIEIPREVIIAQVSIEEEQATLQFHCDLSGLSLPSDSELVLDIWAADTYETKRLPVGPVESINNTVFKFDVTEMRNLHKLRLRCVVLRVVNKLPMILAQADQIQVINLSSGDDGSSILKIHPDSQMELPWELRVEEGIPALYIREDGGLYAFLKSEAEWFKPTVLTDVLGKVFDWYFSDGDDQDRDESLLDKWGVFFIQLGCPSDLIELAKFDVDNLDPLEVEDARKKILNSFAKKFDVLGDLKKIMNQSEKVES